jgi:two-component system LytT family sensor kinase
MDIIFKKVCVLVTVAFALTLLPGFRRSETSLLSVRDRGTALLVFLVLAFVEEAFGWRTGLLSERIVTACAAGLVAGRLVGLIVSLFVTALAVLCHGLPLETIGISMLCGGLIGGWLHHWRPNLAQRPFTGFCLTLVISLLRDELTLFYSLHVRVVPGISGSIGIAPLLQGLGTALILAIVALARDRDKQTQAAISAEVRALQSRMNPHFLFNALNALAALALIAPRKIPRVADRLRHFLQASFDRYDNTLVPLTEELALVRAYLDIESLRLGDRLNIEEVIDSGILGALVPPFSLQPLVENAVLHGVHSSPKAGHVRVIVQRGMGEWLEMVVHDDGQGVPSADVEQLFFAERRGTHALPLLRQRLDRLFNRSFQLEVRSEIDQGTTVTLRIPMRERFSRPAESHESITSADSRLPSSWLLTLVRLFSAPRD